MAGKPSNISNRHIVLEYYSLNPEASTKECADDTGLTRTQVCKIRSELRSEGKLSDEIVAQTFPVCGESEPLSITELFRNSERVKFQDALEQLDVSPSVLRGMMADMRAREGIEIAEIDGELVKGIIQRKTIATLGTTRVKFGVISDPHIGAKAYQPTALKKFVSDCMEAGIEHILCAGDVVDGTKIYPGQTLEQYATTADDQLSSAIATIPRGPKYYMIGGNHDWTWMSNAGGHNLLAQLETQRDDIVFLGFNQAIVPILDGVDALLWHGHGGPAYAKSYKLQKSIEHTALEELRKVVVDGLPSTIRFLFAGHYHTSLEIDEGGIEGWLAGTFASRNGLTDRMLVTPSIRGHIIETDISGARFSRMTTTKLVYKAIEGDWKSYNHEVAKSRVLNPLFT